MVDNRKVCNIVCKGIDGEVAAEGILLRCPEDVIPDNHAILVLDAAKDALSVVCLFRVDVVGREGSAAECGYFEDFTLKMEVGQPEAAADETAVVKKPPDLTGCGVCGDVEVLGGSAHEQIPDATPYQVGNKAPAVKPVERAQGIRAYALP